MLAAMIDPVIWPPACNAWLAQLGDEDMDGDPQPHAASDAQSRPARGKGAGAGWHSPDNGCDMDGPIRPGGSQSGARASAPDWAGGYQTHTPIIEQEEAPS
jgi:hypothetical protein